LTVPPTLITFVTAYTPTEDTEDEIVDEFYKTLKSVCDELPKQDAIITLGNFNAQLGKEQIYRCLNTYVTNFPWVFPNPK